MTTSSSKRATGAMPAAESPTRPSGAGTLIAVSRSRLLGSNRALLTWFITTWPRFPYATGSRVAGSTTWKVMYGEKVSNTQGAPSGVPWR